MKVAGRLYQMMGPPIELDKAQVRLFRAEALARMAGAEAGGHDGAKRAEARFWRYVQGGAPWAWAQGRCCGPDKALERTLVDIRHGRL